MNELAGNLSWTWHSEAFEIFQQLDPELWLKLNRNPVAFLEELSDEALNDRVATKALGSRITRAYFAHHEYLRSTNTWGKQHVRSLKARPVAYFSAEFGLHESLPIYSGGLGLLSGDHLKASSDLDVPLIGVGLLYTKGYFSQSLDAKGWQQEHYYDTDPDQLPLQVATDKNGDPLRLVIKTSHDDTIHVRAWLANVGRCRLLLLDCNVEENNEQNRALTAKLYGGDSRIRIRQELILGVGGMRALNAMGIVPGVIHLNEGHSAFALLELSRLIMERDGKSFADVRDLVSSMSVFTSHTPVAAGHDRFEPALVEETLSSFREMLGLSKRYFLALGTSNP
ncbi:alpha-glucan family phosphorylase, partial [bacterium]|nr:alpha-glucan family phosphorylase [bacterium]